MYVYTCIFLFRKCLFCKPFSVYPAVEQYVTCRLHPWVGRLIHLNLFTYFVRRFWLRVITIKYWRSSLFYIFLKLTESNLYLITGYQTSQYPASRNEYTPQRWQCTRLKVIQLRLHPNSRPVLVNLFSSRENYWVLLCWSLGCFAKLQRRWLREHYWQFW